MVNIKTSKLLHLLNCISLSSNHRAMAVKASFVFVITSEDDSAPIAVYADSASANEAAKEHDGAEVHKLELKGGSVQLEGDVKPTKAAPKPKATKAAPAEDDGETSELAERVKELLSTKGDSLSGCTVVITGVPSSISRKDTESLITQYGGKLTKSLSKNTSFVVVGNDAGPKKLEKIEELGIETLDEEAFVERIGAGGGGKKRAPSGEEDAEPKAGRKKRKA